jgi:hypothetical protein
MATAVATVEVIDLTGDIPVVRQVPRQVPRPGRPLPHSFKPREAPAPAARAAPECAVCLDAPPVVKLSGCVHVCLCVACSKAIFPKLCPLCRKAFKRCTTLVIG